MPVAVPGAAASPGTKSCSFANEPTLTAIDALVLLVMAPWVTSDAVTVALPAVLSVTLKLIVPETKAASEGKPALLSVEVMCMVSLVLIKFQFASTALTMTLNGVPAIWAVGVPILPVLVPEAAVSPGVKICSLANTPGLTVIDRLVLPGIAA